MFVSVPPHIAISDLMQRAKGRSSYADSTRQCIGI
jgi:hypothetical protein